MTIGDLLILSHHEEPGKKTKPTIGLLDPEEAALIKARAYTALPAREKIRRRLEERDE